MLKPVRRGEPIETETLYAVIGAIAEGPDLERVLDAVVDLLVDATACHACFIYLREGDRLTIRAASPVFAHAVGRVSLGIGEGLTGWVARNRTPAFIKEEALKDPRMSYVAELDEERFQSMVAVPLVDRHGDVIGVVVLHTEAPREFGQDVLDLLVHVASLVAGAIDNARLYDRTQRQVAALSALSTLSHQLASLTNRAELYTAGCEGIRRLLAADRCNLAILDTHGAAVEVASAPADPEPEQEALLHSPADGKLTAQLLEGERPMGIIRVRRQAPFAHDDSRLLQTATNQLALALRTAARIERLATDSVVRQVFDALEHGNPTIVAARAAAAGWDPHRPHVAVVALPATSVAPGWQGHLAGEVRERLRLISHVALTDIGFSQVRALVALAGARPSTVGAVDVLRAELATIGTELNVSFGISHPRSTSAGDAAILGEAEDAARVASALAPGGGAQAYDELGAYRFLVELIGSDPPDAAHAQALTTLADYDRQRRSALIDTLDAYLEARGASQLAARRLVIHPNTLRQRLERIQQLSGLRLEEEDLLSLQLSLKVHRLCSPPINPRP